MRETMAVDMEAGVVGLDVLGRELAVVAARLQIAAEETGVGSLDGLGTAEVEAAERTLDARARDLRSGLGDRHDWSSALEAYEQVCLRAILATRSARSLAA
jgi:hypothetical protein